MENQNLIFRSSGFTLIELIAVIVIIIIAAMLAIPMFSSAAGIQIRAAADMIAADLEYAKSMAISRQKTYTVTFDEAAESYDIRDASGIISHPVTHRDYLVNFGADSRVDRVNIVDADFGSSGEQVSFTYLGSPDPDNGGTVTLSADTETMTVTVGAVTGYVSISQ